MAVSVRQLMAEARGMITSMTPGDAHQAMANGAVLIDTRCDADRRDEGIVPGSVHHHRTVLEWRMDPASEQPDLAIADTSLQHIVMCNDGFSSQLAAANLVVMGYARTAHLTGGFRAWKAAGLPVETPA